jgi:amidase
VSSLQGLSHDQESDLSFAGLSRLRALLTSKELSASELLAMQLERLEALNPLLNAVVTTDLETAIAVAAEFDRASARGSVRGPLHGIAITLKDSHAVAGMRSTVGVRRPGDRVPETDGTVAARLRRAGAIILGKTNVSSLLYDFQTESELFGVTSNPWDLSRTPGGSSGGSAAAVAGGLTPFEVGSDLGGSTRVPAAFCGLVGFKPTEGRIPETGHAELGEPRTAWIMESISPLARSVEDARMIYSLLSGPDGFDPTVPPVPVQAVRSVEVQGLRVALARSFPDQRVSSAVADAVEDVAQRLTAAGARVEEAFPELPWEEQIAIRRRLFYMTDGAFRPRKPEDSASVAELLSLLDARAKIIATYERFFERFDVILSPATNTTPFTHRPTELNFEVDGEEVDYWSVGRHVQVFNLLGAPAIVLPSGHFQEGLPIGIQLAGPRWGDDRLLAIAARVEDVAEARFRTPPRPFAPRTAEAENATVEHD